MDTASVTEKKNKIFSATVLVAALGYFVDIYDLQLFNLVSKQSLGPAGLNLPAALIEHYDYVLFLWQMGGMLIGGILWGVLGDRLGRKSVLFGSILLYSIANILNGFVVDTTQYAVIRFVAGFGLAGELGAAVTLVSEILHKESRGWGTMLIVTIGAFGAVAANLIASYTDWQMSYFIGGGLGLLLLFLRVSTFESQMFDHVKKQTANRGNFLMFFNNRQRFHKYIACIAIGLPIWFTVGILVKFSELYAKHTGVIGEVAVGHSIMWVYLGLSLGDFLSGWLSQVFRSRKKAVFLFLVLNTVIGLIYLYAGGLTAGWFYFLVFMLGVCTGYWAVFVSIAAEQFGTNIRATATTTVPNFVRGAVIPLVLSFKYLMGSFDIVAATLIVGGVTMLVAFVSIVYLRETFGKSLDYIE